MSVKTATVEALTAEVRVLMVGSRQITLSVVRQLDWVAPDLIEPFGRVRADRNPAAREIEVVGSLDGILAYSTAHCDSHHCSPDRYYVGERCDIHSGENIPAKGHYWYTYRPSADLYLRWSELPLIVLAGLR